MGLVPVPLSEIQKRKAAALLYLIVVPLVIVIGVVEHYHSARQGAQAKEALCILRADLESRVHSSERFLRDHPSGFLGIPAAVIQSSIAGQRQTMRALSILNCKEAP